MGLTWWSDDLMIWPDILGPAPRSRSRSRAFQSLWSPPGGPCDMPAKIFCDMPAKICDMPPKIYMWYACNHIFSHICDCDMLAGERSVAGSLGLVPGSLWGSAILVWELGSVRSRAMSTTRERPSDGTAELSREVEILPWWCRKRNWPAVVWRSALRWGLGARCCRGSRRRRSLATKLPRDWSRPTLPASDHIKRNNFICEFRSTHAMTNC